MEYTLYYRCHSLSVHCSSAWRHKSVGCLLANPWLRIYQVLAVSLACLAWSLSYKLHFPLIVTNGSKTDWLGQMTPHKNGKIRTARVVVVFQWRCLSHPKPAPPSRALYITAHSATGLGGKAVRRMINAFRHFLAIVLVGRTFFCI